MDAFVVIDVLSEFHMCAKIVEMFLIVYSTTYSFVFKQSSSHAPASPFYRPNHQAKVNIAYSCSISLSHFVLNFISKHHGWLEQYTPHCQMLHPVEAKCR